MSEQKAILLAETVADDAILQNADAFAADFQATRDDGIIRITIAIQENIKVRLVPSSGSGFYMNGGAALTVDTVYVEDVALDVGRTWNIQTDDVAGMTVSILRVQELSRIT